VDKPTDYIPTGIKQEKKRYLRNIRTL